MWDQMQSDHEYKSGLDLTLPIKHSKSNIQNQTSTIKYHSHSIVAGGFELISYVTRFIPFT